MNRDAQSVVVVLLGGLLVGITASGRYTAYVKSGFAPLLWIAGIVLILVGVLSLGQLVRSARPGHPDQEGHDGHDHERSRAPWLVLAPVLVLLVVAPPALGADSLARSGSQAIAGLEPVDTSNSRNDGSGFAPGAAGGGVSRDAEGRPVMEFAPLEGERPVLTFKEFLLRALYDPQESVVDTPVRVTGFVGPPGESFDGGWTLARMSVACCAADATAIRLHVEGKRPAPVDSWVTAVVTAVPGTADRENGYVPTVTVHELEVVPQPADPYE